MLNEGKYTKEYAEMLGEGTLPKNVLLPTDWKAGKTEVWYYNKVSGRQLSMGYDFTKKHEPELLPDAKNLGKTHILLMKINETDKNKIYVSLQGEFWSPNGEARNFISSKGLSHTSMSTGDIIKIGNKVFMIDRSGYKEIK